MTLTFDTEEQLVAYVRDTPRLRTLVTQSHRTGLTEKMQEVLDFIRIYRSHNRHSPSYADICEGCDIKSKSNAFRLIKALRERGYISMLPNQARSIRVLETA